ILHDGRAFEAAERIRDKGGNRDKYLLSRVEYIKRGDLLAIIRANSTASNLDDARYLPVTWFGGVMPPADGVPPTRAQQQQFGSLVHLPPGTVNARDFHDYCMRWFPTVEASASQRFGVEQRGVARSLAGIAVVVLNLDAVHLAYDLYRDRAVAD